MLDNLQITTFLESFRKQRFNGNQLTYNLKTGAPKEREEGNFKQLKKTTTPGLVFPFYRTCNIGYETEAQKH